MVVAVNGDARGLEQKVLVGCDTVENSATSRD